MSERDDLIEQAYHEPACPHPPEAVMWDFKSPGRQVALVNGLLYGHCDLCGAAVARAASFVGGAQ